jgi:hypothetical protein
MLAPHMYRLVALCDVSPEILGHCGEKFHVPEEHRYGDLYVLSHPLSFSSPLPLVLHPPLLVLVVTSRYPMGIMTNRQRNDVINFPPRFSPNPLPLRTPRPSSPLMLEIQETYIHRKTTRKHSIRGG